MNKHQLIIIAVLLVFCGIVSAGDRGVSIKVSENGSITKEYLADDNERSQDVAGEKNPTVGNDSSPANPEFYHVALNTSDQIGKKNYGSRYVYNFVKKHGTADEIAEMNKLFADGIIDSDEYTQYRSIIEWIVNRLPKPQGGLITEIGDVCDDPIVISSFPYTDTRNTCDYNQDYTFNFAPGGPEVVYELTLTEASAVSISLCATGDDDSFPMLIVQSDLSCGFPSNYVANEMNNCGTVGEGFDESPAQITYLPLDAGTYSILVVSQSDYPCGEYTLDVDIVDGCEVVCPSGASDENEACGADNNGGCNMTIPTFEAISNNTTICGTSYFDEELSIRDTDWYEFTLDDTYDHWKIEVTVSAEFDIDCYLIQPGDTDQCTDHITRANYSLGACEERSMMVYLTPGTYWLFLAPNTGDIRPVCDVNDSYYFSLESGAVDAGAPANDWCDDVTPEQLAVGSDLTFTGNNTGATSEGLFYPAGEVWHAFTITEYLSVVVDYCTTDPAFVSVANILVKDSCPIGANPDYYDCVESSNSVCDDGNTTITFPVLPPGTYYIPVITTYDAIGDYTLHVAASYPEEDPPDNDACESAEELISGQTVLYSTIGATFDGDGLCQTENNIWYYYDAIGETSVIVSTQNIEYDTKIAVYDGSTCPPTTLIECNDDYDDVDDSSRIEFTAEEDHRYLIEVGGSNKNGGHLDSQGEAQLFFSALLAHDVGVISISSPRPGELFEDSSYYDIKAYITNNGASTETFNVVAIDDHGFSTTYEDLTLNAGEIVEVIFPDQYLMPSDTCEDYTFGVRTQLSGDSDPDNNSFYVIFRYPRAQNISYENFDDLCGGGTWLYSHEVRQAVEYVASSNEEIVYIGARVCAGEYNIWMEDDVRFIDPAKLYLYFDSDEDDVPDDEPVFESVVKPIFASPDSVNDPNWCYAVLPCGVSVSEGQKFWVAWSDYNYDEWGYYLMFDDIENPNTWYYDPNYGWYQSFESGRYLLGAWSTDGTVGIVNDELSSLPKTFELSQNYPNPFNAQTSIRFALPQASDVELIVYNTLGQKIDVLAMGPMAAGYHSVIWDASDVSTGIYFYKIQAGEFSKTQKMLLLK